MSTDVKPKRGFRIKISGLEASADGVVAVIVLALLIIVMLLALPLRPF